MTEEIIIDGVNVAGCEFYFKDEKYSCDLSFINQEELCKCDDVQDCTYKQLKRLEQERDELKFENDRYKQLLKGCPTEDEDCGLCVIDEQNKRLKQENKELKEWKERVVKLFESACRCKYLNEETDICFYTNEKCININKCVYKYQELSSNYRSALEEIREIVTSAFAKQRPYKEDFAEIETKINEVLNEKEL